MAVEPKALRLGLGVKPLDHAPEPGAVVHLDEMRHLMRDDVVEHGLGYEDEPPREGEIAGARAAAPARRRIAHADAAHLLPDRFGETMRPLGQLALRQIAQEIAHPARQKVDAAGNANLARLDPGGPAS